MRSFALQYLAMFSTLSDRLQGTIKRLRGQARLTEENIQETVREVRKALLEADVALPVVREFINRVRERAIGSEVLTSLTPGQALVKVVHDELTEVMGKANDALDLSAQPPAVILMAGLQGAGKTTSAAKLARRLREKDDKKVMLVSCDVYRPAAIRQLETLAHEVGVGFIDSAAGQNPRDIARQALDQARKQFQDVLIVDTAGRLAIDAEMMTEIADLHALLQPVETLFVVDSMTGQDAANTAKAFNEALPLTGVILTKADGDARGGAALSVRHITGKPIKFMGIGEKTAALEPFHPERLASRILGMGDVLSLVEQASTQVDQSKAEKLARKLKKGKGFDLNDLREQLGQMSKMGGMASLIEKLPGAGQLPDAVKNKSHDKDLGRMLAIIDSMTPVERRQPDMIKGSRKRRIALGSGTQVQDVNRLLKQHQQMSRMMKQFSKGGMSKMMRSLKGKMPGGRMPF
ncbi:signal recognition particle subunit FFH/SRP54 (srp54) [Ectothiorhodosinus mongolicus]|uniref:Signal recognition particle protein n=2 Tax=Ectothiorhodosinus mongolicus TaxID=233100 RepID=A0A1R3W0C9_9GAMM|nr:signal recognition particle subunit FFH/SRP54 (srp54) [Ectothiorhodosinus mongolicus]